VSAASPGVCADQADSPFPTSSGLYGAVVPPHSGDSNYAGRFNGYSVDRSAFPSTMPTPSGGGSNCRMTPESVALAAAVPPAFIVMPFIELTCVLRERLANRAR
jgi:hypothetical protein